MKKLASAIFVAVSLVIPATAGAQIYVPVAPTTGANKQEIYLTNLRARPTFFFSKVYYPDRRPQEFGRFDLQPKQTVIEELAGTPGAFKVIDSASPAVVASSRLTGPEDVPSRRLPVFTSRDVVQARKKAIFQFFPLTDPHASVAFVVLSVFGLTSHCSLALSNDHGPIDTTKFTVPEVTALAVVQLTETPRFFFAEVSCNRPFLVFAYQGAAPTAEIVGPSAVQ
ncbi:MAG TPA: hypothetical protein VGX68_28970 [Thermoanaerobaculia bacterium]|jgi:hypothetical protein|nr:hypothetical protein [Thermoanaerobaculia bacterium]